MAAAMALLVWYTIKVPHVPDLAAQLARSGVAGSSGFAQWWLGWFGGLQLQTYSLFAPSLVWLLGAPAVGSLAALTSILAMADLLRDVPRRRAGTAVFAVFAVIDVIAGRLTFALGFAAALVAVAALKRQMKLSVILAILTCFLSLLAAYFVGVAALAVVLTDSKRRGLASTVAGGVLSVAIAEQLLFRGTGTMLAPIPAIVGALATALGVAWVVPQRSIRVGSLLIGLASVATLVSPGALGGNVVRICWLLAPALVVTFGSFDMFARVPGLQRLDPRLLMAAAALGTAAWPISNIVVELASSADASTTVAFYEPLVRQIRTQAGSTGSEHRIEVVPTRAHWEDKYLSSKFQLARGWDRQADIADNPLFYESTLDAVRYRTWLGDLAVGWVARPRSPLDGAGLEEAKLIDSQPDFLTRVWSSPTWDLYRVNYATALVDGATVVDVQPASLRVHFNAAGVAKVRIRWSPYLVAEPVAESNGAIACVRLSGDFVELSASAAGDYLLTSEFKLLTHRC